MLQTLLGANVGALLKTKIGHQKVSDKQQSFLMAKFRIGEKADRNLTPKRLRGNGAEPRILMICVSEFFTAASQVDSFSLV